MDKPKKGYAIQFNILEKDKAKMKKLLMKNQKIIVRGIWIETKIVMI